jgi:methyltransferase (TIGR00027 family)
MRPREASRASRTAEYMALFRALESVKRPEARLFEDPYAPLFLSRGTSLALAVARLPAVGALVPWLIDRRWPGARSSGVARTRFIDDALTAALKNHQVGQIVVLGAGFDCRALRLPQIAGARVFEVDQPATLERKVERLREHRGPRPEGHVVRVALDFKREELGPVLIRAGFRADRPSFYIWEGVTNYLSADAVDQVLHFVAHESAPRSRILFTYVHRGVIDGSVRFAGWDRLSLTLSKVGEPWSFGIDPENIAAFLRERGLRLVEDLGADDYRARYQERGHGYEFYRAAVAEVGGDP